MMNKGEGRMLALTITLALSGTLLAACSTNDTLRQLEQSGLLRNSGALSLTDISAGLKEALTRGSSNVVAKLGRDGGFNADPAIRIPLPNALAKAREYASKVGLDASFNELQDRLNHAAEIATPKAKELFLGAIRNMTLQDAKAILQGPSDAATRFFERNTRTQLAGAMRPLIDDSLSQVGAVNSFNQLLASYRRIPFAPPVEADLSTHVLDKGLDGIFHYIAAEEKAIRENPLERTTDLLRRVFAAQ